MEQAREAADTGIVDKYVQPKHIRGGIPQDVQEAVNKAQIKGLNARSQLWGAFAFIVWWVSFWFMFAVAAAGIKTAQYVWWYWQPALP